MSYSKNLISEFVDELVDCCQGTCEWYETRLRDFFRYLDENRIKFVDAGPGVVNRYLAKLKKDNCSWYTRNGAHTILNKFFSWAVKRGYFKSKNPFEQEAIKRPRRPRRIKKPLPWTTIPALIKVLKNDTSPQAKRDLALILILLDGGLRRIEAVRLNINDIDLARCKIYILDGKNGDQRIVYVKRLTIDAIRDWLAVYPRRQRPESPLFLTLGRTEHRRLNTRTVNGILRKWCEQAGLPRVRPHDLRRIFATFFANCGGGMPILQNLLGHSDIRTTLNYINPADDQEVRSQHDEYSPLKKLNIDLNDSDDNEDDSLEDQLCPA